MSLNLDGRQFSPLSNSEGGRVSDDAVFHFVQNGEAFTAHYEGAGFSDGHLIGRMTGRMSASLVYHCRAPDGTLEVGEAEAEFSIEENDLIEITMDWRWLNGSKQSGTSKYREIMCG